MTYLVPDDWYANHNLAPGDARLPQKPMQPVASFSASKGLAPTPPMRGYFGPRPTHYVTPSTLTTKSPFAVSDVMWGVNGLGNAPAIDSTAAYQQADRVLAAAQDKIKKQIQVAAAANVATSIALTAIPVVGWVVGPLYGIITGITGSYYKNKAMEVLSSLTNKLERLGVEYQLRLQGVLDQVFEEVKPDAIQLAISNVALNGLGGQVDGVGALGDSWFKKAIDYAFNPVTHMKAVVKVALLPGKAISKGVTAIAPGSSIAKDLNRFDNRVDRDVDNAAEYSQNVLDSMSGGRSLEKAQEAAKKATSEFIAKMDEMYAIEVAKAKSPEYRASLIITIARFLRENPIQGQILAGGVTADNATQQDMQVAAKVLKPSNVLPGIAAAGAVLLVMGLKK